MFVIDKDGPALVQLHSELPEVMAIDLTDVAKSKAAISKLLPLHHLVNNVGMYKLPPMDFLESTLEDLDL